MGVFTTAGVLVAAPYLGQFLVEFIGENNARVGKEYQWATLYSDHWVGALGNLFHPFLSDVHGSFGGTSLIILPFILPLYLLLGKGSVPKSIFFLWAATLVTSLTSLGEATPIHHFFWKYVPLADTFRAPGRISLILIFPILLLLTWLLRQPRSKSSTALGLLGL